MMKGTPCSKGNYASLKTSSKTRTHKYGGPGARPLAGFGAAPQPCLLHRSMVRMLGMLHTQHQSREAGSCVGAEQTSTPHAHYIQFPASFFGTGETKFGFRSSCRSQRRRPSLDDRAD